MRGQIFPLLLLVLALVVMASGCGAGREPAPSSLPLEQVVAETPVLFAPDGRWSRHPHNGRLELRGYGTIQVHVNFTPLGPVELVLRPAVASRHHTLLVGWDGEPIVGPVAVERGAVQIVLEPKQLQPGSHWLSITRVDRPAAGEERLETVFAQITWTMHGETHELDPAELERYHLIADFLETGVTGLTLEKRSGLLFVGPRELDLPDVAPGPGVLTAMLENLSPEPATFVVRLGEAEHRFPVPAQQTAPLRVELGETTAPLRLAVEGEVGGAFLWGTPWIERARGSERVPIFLVTMDTTRRDAISPYGARAELTPNLDRFARTATVFERAYSTAPWTLPSHTSLMTGLYPSRHRYGVASEPPLDQPRLAALLREQGYLTAGIAGGSLCAHQFGLSHGFHLYRDPDERMTAADRMTDYVEEVLSRYGREPLFVFANYFDPHGPYLSPPRFDALVDLDKRAAAVADQPVWAELAEDKFSGWRLVARSEAPATPEGLAYLRAAYDAEVAFTDEQLGRLFATLERLELFDRALIVITADHGELLGEHGLFGHAGRLDPELTAVPLMIKWPGQTEGRRVETLVSGVDLFATILAVAGVEAPRSDGFALDPEGGDVGERRHVFLEEHESRVHPLNPRLEIAKHVYGVQGTNSRQVVWEGGSTCERLGDSGSFEEVPCRGDASGMLAEVEQQLSAAAGDAEEAAGVVSRELEEDLRTLGYID